MTGVTSRLGDDVLSSLANGNLVIVAIGTRSERLGVIDESIIAPSCRLMAAFAVIRRYGMRKNGRGARRRHAIVAAEAGPRRGLVTCVDVARRTRNGAMCRGKRKSGHIVIEM
jgi:hypothetical protein